MYSREIYFFILILFLNTREIILIKNSTNFFILKIKLNKITLKVKLEFEGKCIWVQCHFTHKIHMYTGCFKTTLFSH